MLTQEQNEAITRTGPGTPGGDLLRRYWQPVALSSELPPSGAPVPVDVLGEELVLFRDEDGRVGLLDRHCRHRGTDLSYGRLEDGGLRCLYHGWLYDVNGRCLEQPAEPKGSTFKDKVRQAAYPVVERAGAFFAYLGPGAAPEFPAYDFFTAPAEHLHASKVFIACNYVQANEGNYDPAHVGFLHRTHGVNRAAGRPLLRVGVSDEEKAAVDSGDPPQLEVEPTAFGLRVYQIRPGGPGRTYLRITNFGMPNFSVIAGPQGGDGQIGIWHVPIDDGSHWRWHFAVRRDAPLDAGGHYATSHTNSPEYEAEFILRRKGTNRYLQDRTAMDETFAGMGANFNAHDAFATESQGAIQDRTRENTAASDTAVVAARRLMLSGIDDVRAGKEPLGVVRDPAQNAFPGLLSFDVLADGALDRRDVVRQIIARCAVAAG
jgi:phenylpropionate dioxygenase-like ring-hydroxylating dioxygenase large terminal subunit